MKTSSVFAIPTLLTRKARADTITYNKGKLEMQNWVNDDEFSKGYHTTFHWPDGKDDFDGLDVGYSGPLSWINPVVTKIISRVLDYELGVDTRGLDSFAPVNLELSLHSEHNTPIDVPNLESWLSCIIDPGNKGYDFGVKPITLWRRFPAEPGKLQFLADIREVCAKSDSYNKWGAKIGKIPLPNLNGEYASQDPYGWYQARFDVCPGNLNFSLDENGQIIDGIVDVRDLVHLGNDWGKKGQPLDFLADITGPQGLPDGNVDAGDLELLTRHWLKNIRDIMP